MSTSRTHHTSYIDIFRGVACLYVVIHHCIYSLFDPDEAYGALLTAFIKVFSNGHIAIVIFIVISGLCLGMPVAKAGGYFPESFGRYMLRRSVRILPPYMLALLLGGVMGLTVLAQPMGTGREWDTSVPFDGTAVWLHVLMLEDLVTPYTDKINHPLWTVAVEYKIYVLFPLIALLTRRMGTRWAMATMLGATVSLWWVLYALRRSVWPDLNLGPSGVSPHFLLLFFFGFLLSRQMAPIQRGQPGEVWPLIGFWAVFSALCLVVALRLPPETEIVGRFMLRDLAKAGPVCMFLILLMVVNRQGVIDRWRPGQMMAAMGTMSYSVYLVHAPIIEWVMRAAGAYAAGASTERKLIVSLLIAPGASWLVGWVFFRLVETPSHVWATRLRAPLKPVSLRAGQPG